MAETDKGVPDEGRVEYRGEIIPILESLKKKGSAFTRSCLCHAITVVDLLEIRSKSVLAKVCQKEDDKWILGLTCLYMSYKYLTGNRIKLQSLVQLLPATEEPEELKEKIIQMEETVLNGIDFQFPTINAYDTLDSLVTSENIQTPESRKKVLVTLKVLLIGFKVCSLLSTHPNLATEIYQITKKSKGYSKTALNIYQQCLDYTAANTSE